MYVIVETAWFVSTDTTEVVAVHGFWHDAAAAMAARERMEDEAINSARWPGGFDVMQVTEQA
jgi:hypothetical protein